MSDPIVEPRTAREEVDDALYDASVIADIVQALASAGISGSKEICPTSFEWLGKALSAQIELLRENVGRLGRA